MIRVEINNLPPTLNNSYRARYCKGNCIIYLRQEVKDWKEELSWRAKEAMGRNSLLKDNLLLEVDMYIKRERDIDSTIKFTQDALQGIVYENDKQIVKLNLKKFKGKEEKLIIYIYKE